MHVADQQLRILVMVPLASVHLVTDGFLTGGVATPSAWDEMAMAKASSERQSLCQVLYRFNHLMSTSFKILPQIHLATRVYRCAGNFLPTLHQGAMQNPNFVARAREHPRPLLLRLPLNLPLPLAMIVGRLLKPIPAILHAATCSGTIHIEQAYN